MATLAPGAFFWQAALAGQPVHLETAIATSASAVLTVGWVRLVAWTILALIGVIEERRFFTDRNPPTLCVGLVFLPMIFGIALTEVLVDEPPLIQKAVFSAIAVFAAAAIVTVIVRLIQARHAPHA